MLSVRVREKNEGYLEEDLRLIRSTVFRELSTGFIGGGGWKMSCAGIDLGNRNCVIALARRGGIDVVANEVSNRATP